MKLGPLNSAIRQMKGAPKTTARFRGPDGEVVELVGGLEITKQSLLEALRQTFPGGRSEETYMALTDDGFLTLENGATSSAAWAAPAGDDEAEAAASEHGYIGEPSVADDPLDDLLG